MLKGSSFLTETLLVGLATTVVGLLVSSIIILIKDGSRDLPDRSAYFWMAVGLFVTGALVHILAEVFGVNAWYCKNGYACK